MDVVEAFVAEVVDAGPRMRRVVVDVPRLAQLNLPGAGDEAVGVYVPDDQEGATTPSATAVRVGTS